MASRYDLRMEQIRADRAARRQEGSGWNVEIYREVDGEMTGAGWLATCSTWLLIGGIPMCFLFLPLGVFMLLFGFLLRPAAVAVQPVEQKMYTDVEGKGRNAKTRGWLAVLAIVGAVLVGLTFLPAILVALAML